jgi:hypothetical protein
MAAKPFHLGWFLNFVADEWNGPWGSEKTRLRRTSAWTSSTSTTSATSLVPALQRRGLTRTEYTYDTLRENLLDF